MRDERFGIVVGVDGSEMSHRALAWAAARTDRFGPVRPVVAWEYPTTVRVATPWGPGSVPTAAEMTASAEAVARDQLRALRGVPHLDPVILSGDAGEVLVEIARDAELLVVGTRSRGAVRANLLGSVGRYCADHTPVPLIIVPHRDAEAPPVQEARIVVGVDGTDHSHDALVWGLRTAPDAAEVRAITAWQLPVDGPFLYRDTPFDSVSIRSAAHDLLEQAVEKAAAEVGVVAEQVVRATVEGDPRVVLQHAQHDADLLVVGQRGRTGLPHVFLGSTTTSLIHRPTCPVAVVPY